MLRPSVRNIILLLTMKLFLKVIEYNFGTLAPANFQLTENGTCQLRETLPEFATESTTAITWLYSSRAVFPVLGGLMANACLGYVFTLNLGGLFLLLSTLLLSYAVLRDLICLANSATVVITWLLVIVQFGLLQPCVLYGLYKWHLDQPRMWALLTGAYYSSLKLGGCIALLLPGLHTVMGAAFVLIPLAFSGLFVLLSGCLHKGGSRVRFVMPTVPRMIRYSKIFTFMVFFSISVADTQSTVYSIELRNYMNATGQSEKVFAVSPEMVKLVTQVLWGLALMLAAYFYSKQLPIEPRLYGGIALEAMANTGLLAVSLLPPLSVHAVSVHAVFLAACVLDGAAEVLTMSAGYEIMLGVTQRHSRMLVFGMCFSIWGLANLASRGLVVIFEAAPADNPVLRPSGDRAPQFFIYHLTILGLLAVSVAHYRFSARQIITMLYRTDVDEEPIVGEESEGRDGRESDETNPLVEPLT